MRTYTHTRTSIVMQECITLRDMRTYMCTSWRHIHTHYVALIQLSSPERSPRTAARGAPPLGGLGWEGSFQICLWTGVNMLFLAQQVSTLRDVPCIMLERISNRLICFTRDEEGLGIARLCCLGRSTLAASPPTRGGTRLRKILQGLGPERRKSCVGNWARATNLQRIGKSVGPSLEDSCFRVSPR